jgi:geranylgeranyl diphosphate synthase type II
MQATPSDPLETALRDALERHLQGPDGATPANLAESIRYSLLAPGKRIRPRLALACARLLGLDSRAAMPAALAIEMIHCFTLIHDDLPCMDDDDFRRGRPSNHKVHGEAIALLAGDALMVLAMETLLEAAAFVQPAALQRALKRLCWASGPRGVMGGQAAEALLGPASPLEQLRQMHAMKTGALFSAALLMPMDLAGLQPESPRARALERFAAELGLAFQVADDLDDADEEADRHTSVLRHMSAEQARDDTCARLKEATRALEAAWEANESAELSRIAAEVEASMRRAGRRE